MVFIFFVVLLFVFRGERGGEGSEKGVGVYHFGNCQRFCS